MTPREEVREYVLQAQRDISTARARIALALSLNVYPNMRVLTDAESGLKAEWEALEEWRQGAELERRWTEART